MPSHICRRLNCVLLQHHFDDNFLDRRRLSAHHSWMVGIMRSEDSELSGVHDEIIALRIKEIHVIFRMILRFHDTIQRFPAHLFAAFRDILDVSVIIVSLSTAFHRQTCLTILNHREHHITIYLIPPHRQSCNIRFFQKIQSFI